MNLYQKALLYAYPYLHKMIRHIDKMVVKKALASFSIYIPCFTQANEIIRYTERKIKLIELKEIMDEILSGFSKEDLLYVEYKYFDRRDEITEALDTVSRKYFRKQVKLISVFSKELIKRGLTYNWFEENYGVYPFFKEVLRRVEKAEARIKKTA